MLCPLEHPSCLLCFLDGIWGSAGTSSTFISLIFVFLFQRETYSVAFVEGFLPPGHYLKAVPLHCTLKVLNWLPALCLHTGWVRLSGIASVTRVRALQLFPIDVAYCHRRWTLNDPHPCDAL